MATATVSFTPDQDAIFSEVLVLAPPERVFQALTDPTQLPKWWGQAGEYRITSLQADVRPGGKWKTIGVGADGKEFEVYGEYVEVDPPRVLEHTWVANWTGAAGSLVRWELVPSGGGTLAKLRHSGLKNHPDAGKSYASGWPRVIGWMVAYVEKGATIDTRR